jgi:DNA-binding MarR family transcriptional regulator
VLILLMREDDGMSAPSTLAEKAGVSRATMTGLLDSLERDGLVERIFDAADRRRVSIRLTPAGQAKLDEVMPDYYRRLRQLMAGFSDAEKNVLHSMLERLHQRQGMLAG